MYIYIYILDTGTAESKLKLSNPILTPRSLSGQFGQAEVVENLLKLKNKKRGTL